MYIYNQVTPKLSIRTHFLELVQASEKINGTDAAA